MNRFAERITAYGPAAFILTLPLEFTSVYLHQQLNRFVLLVVLAAFLYLVLRRRVTISAPRAVSLVLLACYVLASLASWATTRSPGSTSSVLDVVLYPVVALLLTNVVVDEDDHRRAWNTLLVSALLISSLGLALFFTHTSIWTPNRLVSARLNITFGDPNITARFLTLGACVAILMFAAKKSPAWLCFATAIACAIVLPMTLSRSGLGLFILTGALAVALAADRRRAATLTAMAFAAFVLSIAINPVTLQRTEDATATAVSAITGKPATLGHVSPDAHAQYAASDNRVYLVRAGMAMFKDHPLSGVGYGGYQHALTTTYHSFLPSNLGMANLDTLSHASLVTVMAEQGMLGTLLFLGFLLALAVEAWRTRRHASGGWTLWSTIPATLMIPIFLYSQIEGRFIGEPYFWLSLGLLYSAVMALRGRTATVWSAEPEPLASRRVRVA